MSARTDQWIERQLRSALKYPRLFVAYAPFGVVRRLQHIGMYRIPLTHGISTRRIDTPRGEWYISSEADEHSPVILYIHGGGFVLPQTHLHRVMVAHLTKQVKGRTLMVDYRLAPEHPFPAGLDDCIAAYEHLLDEGVQPHQITVMGDSAGGNLMLGLLITLRDRGIPLPSLGVSMSAPTDMTADNPARGRTDDLLHPRAADRFSLSYVVGQDVHNPLISPLFADLHGLPPLMLYAGQDEALCGDSERFAEAAEKAGIEVTLKVYPGMWHVWQLMMQLPQARQSLSEIVEAVCLHSIVSEPALQPDSFIPHQ